MFEYYLNSEHTHTSLLVALLESKSNYQTRRAEEDEGQPSWREREREYYLFIY